jgi:Asp-tRNA(Asn)/Glu-tRNA(Gln) amidotransferase B subunit
MRHSILAHPSVQTKEEAIPHVLECVKSAPDYFEKIEADWVVPERKHVNPKAWNKNVTPLEAFLSRVHPGAVARIIERMEARVITRDEAKEVQRFICCMDGATPDSVDKIIKILGFVPAQTEGVENVCQEILSQFPEKVQEYRGGNTKVINWLLGQVMKRGRYDARDVSTALSTLLSTAA